MNLRLKEELLNKCNDKVDLKDFFDDIDFLENIGKKNISHLSLEERKRVDNIIDFLEETSLTIIYMFLEDYYLKPSYKFIRYFLIRLDKKFYDINEEYYDMTEGYSRRMDEVDFALDSIERLNMSELKMLYELIFLTFITSINDLAIFDYNMLNKNKYSYSDLEDLSSIKSSAKAYELSLITMNRKLKKENS